MATSAAAAAGGSSVAVDEVAVEVHRKDYRPVPYAAAVVDLLFQLHEEATSVVSTIKFAANPAAGGSKAGGPLELNGAPEVELVSLSLDGVAVPASGYERTPKGGLLLKAVPGGEGFTLRVETRIKPQENTSLEGLYKSSGNFSTQCEAEGFRRITFFQDRPDVMAVYTVRLEADKAAYPVLLSNGNLVDSGDVAGQQGRHFAVWHDPFVKPCYLFALVAGNLACTEDVFVTKSGRSVALRIWTQHHNASKTAHAMVSLKKSMAWDEQRFGLEYDLDLFNIVAVDDFNMGAMENKSLNIFNSRLVLATPETATDGDYMAIESVIAHEYFHNWTGNRVTCQNWFQLSLKEGLTVYRDQEFSADVNSRGVQRLSEVSRLRAAQFPQDSGPLAHPVRPESYVKMDNFYTVTVYEKGAEVVRMYATLLGRAGFRKGMDLYFQRHDGQAVTCDDFLAAMADANGVDLSDFGRWYAQAGTPRVKVSTTYDAAAKTVTLACSQHTPATPGQADKLPVVIPLAVGLLDPVTGKDLRLSLVSGPGSVECSTAVLRFATRDAVFVLQAHDATDGARAPVPSLLRDFSAPVVLECADLTEENLVFLMAHDSDAVNRWDAGQTLARRLLLRLVAAYGAGDRILEVPATFIDAMRAVLVSSTSPGADKAFIARAMALPTESELIEAVESADPVAVHEVRKHVVRTLAAALQPQLQAALSANTVAGPYTNDGPARAMRSLKNMALAYLAALRTPDIAAESLRRYKAADNMTDQVAALAALSGHPSPQREEAMAAFATQWGSDPLVMNKWFSIRGGEDLAGNVAAVQQLLSHPAFDAKNPNKWYSLVGGFCGSAVNFHAADGSGYAFLADCVLQLDKSNAQVASRLAGAFSRWRRYDGKRQEAMKAQMERLAKLVTSENVIEIITKSLA